MICVLQFLALIISVCQALEVRDSERVVFGQPSFPGIASNLSNVDSSLSGRDLLEPRQGSCYAPNGYCSNTGRCCPPDYFKCCPGGCGRTEDGACCSTGTCKPDTPLCCQNSMCLGYQDECCLTEGWACPSPFKCVLYAGEQGCCTDLKCTVYLGTSGTTVTRTPDPVVPETIGRTVVITPPADFTTTIQDEGPKITAGLDYTIYYTTYYWTYWYYYYTFYYYAALQTTTTTRTVTTVTETTTLTCSATDTYEAASIFRSSSDDLPTPSDANSVIPIEPTAGAIILGNCTTASRSGSATSICQTATAEDVTTTRSRAGGTSTGFGSGQSGAEMSSHVPKLLQAFAVLGTVFIVWL